MVPSRVMDRDRTYGSAVALRNWFRDHNMAVPGINVVTEDLHARRTRLLFQKAFGKDVQVGIIAVANVGYPANRWWRYSQGLEDVVTELAAYLYARLLFFPPEHSGSRKDGSAPAGARLKNERSQSSVFARSCASMLGIDVDSIKVQY